MLRGVHTLVLEAFVGPAPSNHMCRHLDGTRDNNRLENLRWGTNRENVADRIRHGVPVGTKGELHPRAKLTVTDVVAIRASDETNPKCAKRYGISQHQVSGIRRGYYWKDAPFPRGRPASVPQSMRRDYVPPCRRIQEGAGASDGPPKPPVERVGVL